MFSLKERYTDPPLVNKTQLSECVGDKFKNSLPTKRSEEWRYSTPNYEIQYRDIESINNSCNLKRVNDDKLIAEIHSKLDGDRNNPFHSYNLVSSKNYYLLEIDKDQDFDLDLTDLDSNSFIYIRVFEGIKLSLNLTNRSIDHLQNYSIYINVENSGAVNLIDNISPNVKAQSFYNFQVDLDERSYFEGTLISLDPLYRRDDFTINLRGEESSYNIGGVAILGKSNESHTYIRANHLNQNCIGKQLFKNIIFDKGRSSFDGLVYVERGASGTDSDQMNSNLLLSDDGRSYARPQLKIYNDDVKCNHGSNNGDLSEDRLNYLRSRGLNIDAARALLITGFANEVIGRVQRKEIYQRATKFIENRVENGR